MHGWYLFPMESSKYFASNWFYFNHRWGMTSPMVMDKNGFLVSNSVASADLKVGYVSQYPPSQCFNKPDMFICVHNDTKGLVLKRFLMKTIFHDLNLLFSSDGFVRFEDARE